MDGWLFSILVWLVTTSAWSLAMATANTCLTCCPVECGTGGGFCSSTPASVTITATGFSNNGCSACADYNATYIIPRDTGLPFPSNCNWILVSNKGCRIVGNNDSATVSFSLNGTDTEIGASISINGPSGIPKSLVFWSAILGAAPVACGSLGTFTVPINTIFDSAACNHDSSDLTVTIT